MSFKAKDGDLARSIFLISEATRSQLKSLIPFICFLIIGKFFEATFSTFKSKTEKKMIPNFLVNKKIIVDDLNTLLNGLKLVSDFLEKTILKPNNLNYPISRTQFINTLR